MDPIWELTLLAALLGLSGGIAPGPLLTLTITETLQHSWRAGFKVAFTPVLTDTPLILILWPLLHWASHLDTFFGAISVGGGLFLIYLAYGGWFARPPELDQPAELPRTFRKAALTNLLNPAPYLFWAMVGIPLMIRAQALHWSMPLVVYGLFFGLFVGTKCGVALLVERLRGALHGNGYRLVSRLLALALAVFAVSLFIDAVRFFGWTASG